MPVIVLTGQGSESVAVEAMKNGAQDYLLKGTMTAASLLRAVENAIEKVTLLRGMRRQTRELSDANEELQREVANRKRAEEALQRTYDELEQLVAPRTAELSRANRELSLEVAERRRIEEERAQLLVREQQANRLKDEFLATVSHELRTPLNAVLGWARVLRSANVDPALQSRALESIERNAHSQARLIEDILDVSRIVTGKLRLKVQALDLAQVIDAAVDVVRPAAEAQGHRRSRPTSPAGRGASVGDADRLQQIVWNLLSNAVKFTPRGGTVTAALARTTGSDEIIVSDTGKGIDPAFLPHVFAPFPPGGRARPRAITAASVSASRSCGSSSSCTAARCAPRAWAWTAARGSSWRCRRSTRRRARRLTRGRHSAAGSPPPDLPTSRVCG